MQSIRNGGYNIYKQNKKKDFEKKHSTQEFELTKSNISAKSMGDNPIKQEEKAIAGETPEKKQPCENEDLEFMKLKIDKLEEEVRVLRREIENLVEIILNQIGSKKIYSDGAEKESTPKSNSKKVEKKPAVVKNNDYVRKEKKRSDIVEKKQGEMKELHSSLQQKNNKVEEVIQLIKDKRYNEAVRLVDLVLDEEREISTVSILYYWKGEALFYTKEYSKALECFQKVLSFPKSSKRVESQIMIAECYTKLGKLKEAKREYQKFIEEFPFSEYTPRAKRMIQQL